MIFVWNNSILFKHEIIPTWKASSWMFISQIFITTQNSRRVLFVLVTFVQYFNRIVYGDWLLLQGASEKAYRAVYQEEDDNGRKGVNLSKELMEVAGDALKSNLTILGPLVLPWSEQVKEFHWLDWWKTDEKSDKILLHQFHSQKNRKDVKEAENHSQLCSRF